MSIAVFGLYLVGIADVWAVRQSALDGAADTFDRADGILDRAAQGASEIRASLEHARPNLRAIKEAPAAKSIGGREPGFLGKRAARAVAQELTAKLGDVRRTTDRVAETAVVLETLLEAVNKLLFTSANQLDTRPLTLMAGKGLWGYFRELPIQYLSRQLNHASRPGTAYHFSEHVSWKTVG